MRFISCGWLVLSACATSGLDADSSVEEPAPVEPTVFDGLRDEPGPIPGLVGFTFVHTVDASRCGGVAVRVMRAPGAQVAHDDQPFVALLERSYPIGLDFERDDGAAAYRAWIKTTSEISNAAIAFYRSRMRDSSDADVRHAAAARMAQVWRYFSSMVVRAEIPVPVRSGEHAQDKAAAFCGGIVDHMQGLLASGATCVDAGNHAEGWWSTVCRP